MNKQIYIEKLAEVTGGLPARSMDEHIMGKPNDNYSSIPIEYNLEGYLLYEIVTIGLFYIFLTHILFYI